MTLTAEAAEYRAVAEMDHTRPVDVRGYRCVERNELPGPWSWNNDFWMTEETVAGTAAITFDYDAEGLLTRAGALELTRDAGSGMLRATTLGGVTESWGYNEAGEVMNTRLGLPARPCLRSNTDATEEGGSLRSAIARTHTMGPDASNASR